MTIVLFINPSANSVAIILQYSHVDCKGFLDIICKKLNYFTIFCSKLHFPRFTDMIFTKIVEVSSNLQKTIIFSKKKFRKRPRVILPNRRSRGAGESRAESPGSLLLVFCRGGQKKAANARRSTQAKPPAQPLFTDILVWGNYRPSRQRVSHISWSLIILLSCKTASSYPFADLSSMISFCISLFPGKANAP